MTATLSIGGVVMPFGDLSYTYPSTDRWKPTPSTGRITASVTFAVDRRAWRRLSAALSSFKRRRIPMGRLAGRRAFAVVRRGGR